MSKLLLCKRIRVFEIKEVFIGLTTVKWHRLCIKQKWQNVLRQEPILDKVWDVWKGMCVNKLWLCVCVSMWWHLCETEIFYKFEQGNFDLKKKLWNKIYFLLVWFVSLNFDLRVRCFGGAESWTIGQVSFWTVVGCKSRKLDNCCLKWTSVRFFESRELDY